METFCVQFWTALDITPLEGFARPCCVFRVCLGGEKPPVVSDQTFGEAINSETYINWRRQILAGKAVAGCQQCYIKESHGSVSDRLLFNRSYEYYHGKNPREVFVEADPAKLKPLALSLHMGNTCNLKCRMCGPQASSSIASDKLHRDWAVHGFGISQEEDFGRNWSKDPQQLIEKISQVADTLVHLHVSGGEPLILPSTRRLFEYLICANYACNIDLHLPSNGTRIDDTILSLLSRFRSANIRLSIDGSPLANEYIRYPSRWDEIMTNIARLKSVPNIHLSVGFTLSAYNIFEPIRVYRWATAENIHFEYGFVEKPYFLNPVVLPGEILKNAAAKIFTFLEGENADEVDYFKKLSFNQLKGVANYLKEQSQHSEQGNLKDKFHEFVVFTKDLDRDREQRLADACPELWAAIGGEKDMIQPAAVG